MTSDASLPDPNDGMVVDVPGSFCLSQALDTLDLSMAPTPVRAMADSSSVLGSNADVVDLSTQPAPVRAMADCASLLGSNSSVVEDVASSFCLTQALDTLDATQIP